MDDVLVLDDELFGQPLPRVPDLPAPAPAAGTQNPSTVTETGVDLTTAFKRLFEPETTPFPGFSDRVVSQGQLPGNSVDRHDRSTTIILPRLPKGHTYLVTETVRIPPNRNVVIKANAPHGARLRAGAGVRYVFRSGGGQGTASAQFRSHVFENLVFHGAGVLLESDARGRTRFQSCAFHRISGWAIETRGTGVVGVQVLDCEFAESDGGGVRVGHSGCDNWIIGDGSTFVRLGGPGVEIRSSGVHVRNAYFESRLRPGLDNPYIRVADSLDDDPDSSEKPRFTGGNCRITDCRFGGEVSKGAEGPPAYCIDLTPDRAGVIIGVQIDQNWFMGWTGNTATTPRKKRSAIAPIRIGKRAHLVSVTGNYFRQFQYSAGVVIDDRLVVPEAAVGEPGVNVFSANCVDVAARRPPASTELFFETGGARWSVSPPAAS